MFEDRDEGSFLGDYLRGRAATRQRIAGQRCGRRPSEGRRSSWAARPGLRRRRWPPGFARPGRANTPRPHACPTRAEFYCSLAYSALACFRGGCRDRRVRQGAVRTQKFSSMTTLLSYRLNPNARYLPSRDGRGSKIHAGPTGPLSMVFTLPSRLTEAIWKLSSTGPET